MSSMKMRSRICVMFLLAGALATLLPARLPAQSTGRIEFTARVAPTGGQPEPVRQLTFYLLRKSLEDIRAEALESAPAPDMDKFIDAQTFSPELKTWMKKHHSVQLYGEDFTKSIAPREIVDVPEFFKAYMARNAAYKGVGFPEPKFMEKDREANPEKYKQEKDQYLAAITKFVAALPESVQGIDVELNDVDPYPKWDALVQKQRRLQEAHALEIAQQRYLVAQSDTDLDGHGSFAGVTPGNYWIGMLGSEAISGDVHLHWDYPVSVRRGETARVQLSNLNASKPSIEAHNSTN